MKRISIYIKGNRNSTAYYRIYQYFDRLTGVECTYHTMMSDAFHDRYMPISQQPLPIKAMAWLHMLVRMLLALWSDLRRRPDSVVIHKRIISRYTPSLFNSLLRRIKRHGTQVVWDFDDHIVANHEVSQRQFDAYAAMADVITVTHDYLRQLLPADARAKSIILPTTDGDMHPLMADASITTQRLQALQHEVRLVWVGTSSNLSFITSILPQLDAAALRLHDEQGKNLSLHIVCDKQPAATTEHLSVRFTKWSRAQAIAAMREAHIGLMPLPDNAFTKGKGAFKLIQYLSIGLPSIGSSVGYNRRVITPACGRLIERPEEWADAILSLSDAAAWQSMSQAALQQWESQFSYEHNLATWQRIVGD